MSAIETARMMARPVVGGERFALGDPLRPWLLTRSDAQWLAEQLRAWLEAAGPASLPAGGGDTISAP